MNALRLFGRFFVDDAGEPSSQRLLSFLLVVMVLGVWVWKNLQSGAYVELGAVEGGLVGSAFGFLALKTKFEAAQTAQGTEKCMFP